MGTRLSCNETKRACLAPCRTAYREKIEGYPEFPSPQFPFHFGVPLKYCSRRRPLQALYHIGYRIFRRNPQKYVNMILRNLHLFYLKLMAPCDLLKALLNKFSHVSSQYPFSVPRSPHYVISCLVYGMCCSSYSHAYRLGHFAANLKDTVSSPL